MHVIVFAERPSPVRTERAFIECNHLIVILLGCQT